MVKIYRKDIFLIILKGLGLGLWCLTPLSRFQQYFSYIVAVNFIGGGNRSTREKNTDLPQVTDKLYHIVLYRAHLPERDSNSQR